MYPAYIQLVAKWSSPSICSARATGWGRYNCKIKDHKKKKTKHLHWLAAPADWQQPVLLEPTTTSSSSSRSKSRTSSSWRRSSCSSRSSISRNTRKSTPQILAFSPQPCAAPCVPWLSTVVLCVSSTINILCAALCVVCCVVVHFALCAFDSSRLLCVHFHRRLFLTNQTHSKGMKDRQLHRY